MIGDERTGQAIVLDPGDEADRIFEILKKHRLEVAAIVATHAHIDHVGALASLKQLTGAPAMIHEGDVPLYEQMAMQAAWLGIPAPATTKLDRYLGEGDRLLIGSFELGVVHTPGHSPGSVSFVLGDKAPMIFSGDTLFAGSVGRTDLWGGSFTTLIDSIRSKLLVFPDDVVVMPGHGPRTTVGTERRSNPFLVHQV